MERIHRLRTPFPKKSKDLIRQVSLTFPQTQRQHEIHQQTVGEEKPSLFSIHPDVFS